MRGQGSKHLGPEVSDKGETSRGGDGLRVSKHQEKKVSSSFEGGRTHGERMNDIAVLTEEG